MSYLQLFEDDRRRRRPEGFLVLTRSGLLRYGARVGTTVGTTDSENAQGSLPVLSQSMHRLTSRSRLIAARLVTSNLDVSRGMGSTLMDGVRVQDTATEGAKRVLLRASAGCRRGTSSYATVRGRHAFEYPWRIGLATLGLMRMVGANDRLSRYLGLEWSSLSLYVLASIRRGSAYSTEAGLKYFVRGAVASGVYLFGASLLYGVTGSIQFGERSRRRVGLTLPGGGAVTNERGLAVVMVRRAFRFKLAVAPFHAWSPDVYEGSPTPSSVYFAVVPKRAMVMVILRLTVGAFSDRFGVRQSVRRLGSVLSLTVGALGARSQRRWKRFRAYSSIGHMGYLRLGVSSGSLEGVQGARLYAIVYVVMSLTMWLGMMSLTWRQVRPREVPSLTSSKYRTDRNGLATLNPVLAATLTLGVRSMAGVPPRAGFLAKRWVFMSAVSQSLVASAIVGVLTSCVGALYYLRWVKLMYFEGVRSTGEMGGTTATLLPMDRTTSWRRGVNVGLRRLILLVPGPLRTRTHRMALAICRGG